MVVDGRARKEFLALLSGCLGEQLAAKSERGMLQEAGLKVWAYQKPDFRNLLRLRLRA